MNITRTTNPNGTYRYTVNGEVHYKASKRRYTHASLFSAPKGALQFHGTRKAADKNKGYAHLGWVKEAVIEITDGDAAPVFAEGDRVQPRHATAFYVLGPGTVRVVDHKVHVDLDNGSRTLWDPSELETESVTAADECVFCNSHPPYTPGDKIPTDACPHWEKSYPMTDEELDRIFSGPKKTISNETTTAEHTSAPKTIYDLPIAQGFWSADARDMNC